MTRYIWDVPPRMKKKSSNLFGTLNNIDVFSMAGCIVAGIVMFLLFKGVNTIVALILAVVPMLAGFYFFIMSNQYGENNRIKIKRMIAFNNHPKIYYFMRNQKTLIPDDTSGYSPMSKKK